MLGENERTRSGQLRRSRRPKKDQGLEERQTSLAIKPKWVHRREWRIVLEQVKEDRNRVRRKEENGNNK